MLLFYLRSPLVSLSSFVSKDLPPSNAAPTISLNKVLRMLTRLNCLCPTPSCSCPSGNCSHAHSWSGSGCCQAQAGAPLFAPAHSLLLNFCQMPGRGTFHFSQVANQARAAASLQQGLIMAEVEFSSPLRRDNAHPVVSS